MVNHNLRNHRARLANIQNFDQLVTYLRDEMDWPIDADNFEEESFEYTPQELGIDANNAAKIQEIKRLRPLDVNQPWGIIFVKFEPKYLPVEALRRILGHFANRRKKQWEIEDLLFISNYGHDDQRRISFGHFSTQESGLPILKVISWDDRDTALHLDQVAKQLTQNLVWPGSLGKDAWRKQWREAFTVSHGQVVNTAKVLSKRLAQLAQKIRKRIINTLEIESEDGHITKLLENFQETLYTDIDAEGFADMVAQTITYGILSARITDPKQSVEADLSSHLRTNPLLSDLMSVFIRISREEGKVNFDELGVDEVKEFLSKTDIESVLLDFGDRNPREDPVIHFYENFLADYDKDKKMTRGVFYTPRPVVSYIVRSIDELLRDKFGLVDGLADTSSWHDVRQRIKEINIPEGISPNADFVQILDPAAGTGTFLVEVIDLIYQTLEKKWQDQGLSELRIGVLWNEYVPKHLLPRLHGYELLMAPYVIAHFKVSLKLHETGYQFNSNERARIYLTNSLEPHMNHTPQLSIDLSIPALANEALEVDKVKQDVRFTVVLGNPPYSGHSANKNDWIGKLLRGNSEKWSMENYFSIAGRPLNEKNPKWLNDDYVKFTRFAHWQIERTGWGVIGFVTNHGYLDNPTFRGLRESLLNTFSTQYLIDLHGNTKKQERSPDDGKDENVFDIQQGVAIGLFVRSGRENGKYINRSDLWGRREQPKRAGKYDWLEENSICTTKWTPVSPVPPLWLFAAHDEKLWNEYSAGWRLTDIFPVNSVGIVTARDKLTIQFTEEEMNRVVNDFASCETEEAREHYKLGKDSRDWKVALAQKDIQSDQGQLCPILYRPFDARYTYYTGKSRGFICMPRPAIMSHMLTGDNLAIISVRQQSQIQTEWRNFGVTETIIESCAISNKTKEIGYLFPLYTFSQKIDDDGKRGHDKVSNLNREFIQEFEKAVGLKFIEADEADLSNTISPKAILHWVYAIFHSTGYRQRYGELLKQDFPHIPFPKNKILFRELIMMGSKLTSLHLLKSDKLNNASTTYIGSPNPTIGRTGWSGGTIWINAKKVVAHQGYRATKRGSCGFTNVSESVWDFHVGSYQVCHKWLKDRQGQALCEKDIAHYLKIICAINHTIPIMSTIESTIEEHGGWPHAFYTRQESKHSNPHSNHPH